MIYEEIMTDYVCVIYFYVINVTVLGVLVISILYVILCIISNRRYLITVCSTAMEMIVVVCITRHCAA